MKWVFYKHCSHFYPLQYPSMFQPFQSTPIFLLILASILSMYYSWGLPLERFHSFSRFGVIQSLKALYIRRTSWEIGCLHTSRHVDGMWITHLTPLLPLKGTIRQKFDYDFMDKFNFSKVKGESMVKYAKKMSTMYSWSLYGINMKKIIQNFLIFIMKQ